MKKVLAVFAHPDDEAFGPGGTIALWARQGIEIHLLCATRGEAGECQSDQKTADVRTHELEASAKILGIQSIKYLNYIDGQIGNKEMIELEKIITQKINEIQPDTLLTFNLNGVSGHLDHIAVASATTQAFEKNMYANKLYYYTVSKRQIENIKNKYFVYVPEGCDPKQVNEIIDVSSVWDTKVKAMYCHQSQISDVKRILNHYEKLDMEEYFIVGTK